MPRPHGHACRRVSRLSRPAGAQRSAVRFFRWFRRAPPPANFLRASGTKGRRERGARQAAATSGQLATGLAHAALRRPPLRFRGPTYPGAKCPNSRATALAVASQWKLREDHRDTMNTGRRSRNQSGARPVPGRSAWKAKGSVECSCDIRRGWPLRAETARAPKSSRAATILPWHGRPAPPSSSSIPLPKFPCPTRRCSRAAPSRAANQITRGPPRPERVGRAQVVGRFRRSLPLSHAATGGRSRSALVPAPPLCVHRVSVVHRHRLDSIVTAFVLERLLRDLAPDAANELSHLLPQAAAAPGEAR